MQGKILASRYQIIRYIAKGGFGQTYLAKDIDLPNHNRCVVKQLYPQINDPNSLNVARRLFQKEGETLNKLNHPQIPRLVAYFEEEQQFYLVQEYIEGHTLSQELKPGSIWSENNVVELLKDCLNILDFIHSNGVIHRDVKPDNLIRRNSDRKLVLVDFGTVKEFALTQSQLIPATVAVGTRGYMPTEQAIGKPRPSSDLYALGMIGIQALTGIHPLELPEDEYGELLWQPQAQVSPQLAAILTKMVRYHFGDRYHSAQEALNAINTYSATTVPPTVSARYTPTGLVNNSQLSQSFSASEHPTTLLDSNQTKPNRSSALNSAVPEQKLSSFPQTNNVPISQAALTQHSSFERNSSIPNSLQDTPVENSNRSKTHFNKSKQKSLIALASAIALGGAAGGIYWFNQNNTQVEQQNLNEQVQQLNTLIAQNQYTQCYQQITQTLTLPQAQKSQFQVQCGLGMAKQKAQSLNYGEALAIIAQLPQNTSFADEIEQLTNQWSQQLFQEATAMYTTEGKLAEALELIQQIPENSSIKSQTQTESDRWKTEYDTNKSIIANAQEALQQKNWQEAKQTATQVQTSTSSYWREQAEAIISEAEKAIAVASPPVTPNPPIIPTTPAPATSNPVAEESPEVTNSQPSETANPVEEKSPEATNSQPSETANPVEEESPEVTNSQPSETPNPVEEESPEVTDSEPKSTSKPSETQTPNQHYGNMPVDDFNSSQPQPEPQPQSEDNSDWAL
ncbi:serine/threonine protein kinase [Stanieria cyanosphaera PCC 7437]|uniref:non-specific serine/threonine protein kinase n=1 Tax=Stanieria cyanosphaera (strain ATCC 29371 / PCC 7437) TaxID=111780 RepID=K9XUX2_STAC7|nr:protein kinase [Stanieria cyanosphaera]AFZ36400.1 serine/threonine protein kinase [Stanieria cyanosphaera PCC 7437]